MMYRLLVPLVLLVTQVAPTFSQYNHDKYWLTVGAGFTFRDSFFGRAFGGAFSYKPSSFVLSARYMNGRRVEGIIEWQYRGGIPVDRLDDLSVLAGLSQDDGSTIFSLSAGPGFVNGRYSALGNNRTFSVLGVSLEGQAIFILGRSLGIGGYLYANINKEASYVGIWLSIRVGHFGKW